MNTFYKIAFVIILLAAPILAAHVAILETTAGSGIITLGEKQYLTDVLRSEAIKALPAEQNYIIMTRENINMMLPPGKSIEDCEGTCLVETGKNISADFVAQGHVGKFADNLTITIELYETATNKLMGSFSSKGENINMLEIEIRQKSKDLFALIPASVVGQINLQPAFSDQRGPESELSIKIDGETNRNGRAFSRGLWEFAVGIHALEFTHPCYEPQSFQLNVPSGKVVDVMNVLNAAMKKISVKTTFKGEQLKVPIYVNGVEVGYTPWQGKVPVCAKIEVGESSYREMLNVVWTDDETTAIEYELRKFRSVQDDILENSTRIAQQTIAEEAAKMAKEKDNVGIAKPVSIMMVVLGFVSFVAGIYENSVLAKERDEYDEAKYANQKDYDDQWDKIESTNTLRNIFWGTAAVLVGAGITIYFVF